MNDCNVLTSNVLFESTNGYSYQCDTTNTIVIHFKDTTTRYKVRDFLLFQRQVNSVSVLDMLYDLSDHSDAQLIQTTKRDFSLNLTICEIVQFKELLNGTQFALHLNSLINKVLSVPVL